MAMESVSLDLNGQVYTLDYDSSTKKWKKTVTAPTASSYNQTDHVYAMTLKAVDVAGNVTVVDKTDSTFGNLMKLRVKEKVAPAISVIKPSAGAYLTSHTVAFSINVTDSGSGVSNSTISANLDGTALGVTKKTITNGYQCTYSGTVNDGAHKLVVTASDNDGNTASKTVNFTVDTVPPTLNITSPAANLITNKQACAVSGITDDATSKPVTVKVSLNGTDQGSVTVASDGTFSSSVNLIEGTNTIVIIATDKAGKVTTVNRTVVYNSVSPVIVSIDVPTEVESGSSFTITVEATD